MVNVRWILLFVKQFYFLEVFRMQGDLLSLGLLSLNHISYHQFLSLNLNEAISLSDFKNLHKTLYTFQTPHLSYLHSHL